MINKEDFLEEQLKLAPFLFDTIKEKQRYDNFTKEHQLSCGKDIFPTIKMCLNRGKYHYELWCPICGTIHCITDLRRED